MKNYKKSGSIHACKLDRDDLIGLINVIKEGFNPSERIEDFVVSTSLPNISIDENSIEEYLNHEELPDIINRLSIRQIGWSSDSPGDINIDKVVRMTFYDNYISLDVEGTSQSWTLGKFEQITSFLKQRKVFSGKSIRMTITFVSSGVIGILIPVAVFSILKGNYFLLSGTILLAFTLILANIFLSKDTFLPYTQIILRQLPLPFYKKEKSINLTIAVLTLLSFIVLIIGTIHSWTNQP